MQKTSKVVIFGGSGYVGQHIMVALHSLGCKEIVCINRSGKPKAQNMIPALSSVISSSIIWHAADINDYKSYESVLANSTSCISTVGGFGTNEYMHKINGDANIVAIEKSYEMKAEKFIYVSTVDNNLPSFILKGYFEGKRNAEAAVQRIFKDKGYVLKPSFVYGSRLVPVTSSLTIPLPMWLLGQPLELFLRSDAGKNLKNVPFCKALLTAPIAVTDVSTVAAAIALDVASNSEEKMYDSDQIYSEAHLLYKNNSIKK